MCSSDLGGGNTSSKIGELDPLSKQQVEVLWVKGSGGDLRTSTKENFSSLYQEKLLALQKSYGAYKDRGPKSQRSRHDVAQMRATPLRPSDLFKSFSSVRMTSPHSSPRSGLLQRGPVQTKKSFWRGYLIVDECSERAWPRIPHAESGPAPQ